MTQQTPTIGRIVHYVLSEQDADAINARRKDAERMRRVDALATGVQNHIGNVVQAGDTYPMIIVRVWGSQPESAVNGQVLLDGPDTFWATSRSVGEGQGHFAWPGRV